MFDPDYIVAPGDILSEYLSARGIDRSAFAARCGLSVDDLTAVGIGAAEIDQELADAIARELGEPSSLWTNLETDYRHRLAVQGGIDSRVAKFVREAKADVFLRRDFAPFGRNGLVNNAVETLIADGRLVRVGRGIYARSFPKVLQGRRISVLTAKNGFYEVCVQVMNRLGIEWMPTIAVDDYNSGRSTQIPVNAVFRVRGRRPPRLTWHGRDAVFEAWEAA